MKNVLKMMVTFLFMYLTLEQASAACSTYVDVADGQIVSGIITKIDLADRSKVNTNDAGSCVLYSGYYGPSGTSVYFENSNLGACRKLRISGVNSSYEVLSMPYYANGYLYKSESTVSHCVESMRELNSNLKQAFFTKTPITLQTTTNYAGTGHLHYLSLGQ